MKPVVSPDSRDVAQPPANRRASTVLYAAEIICTTAILAWAFRAGGLGGVGWAVITAILILHPGVGQSLKASQVRIVATLIGASIGTVTGLSLGGDETALLTGILAAIVFCHAFGLDHHLRQACLTVPIVQMQHDRSIIHVSYERTIAILAGCAVPILVQYAGRFAYGKLARQR